MLLKQRLYLRLYVLVFCTLLLGCNATSNKVEHSVVTITPNGKNIKAHMDFLAHDLLEGRETGTRGHEIASLYIANEFQKYGLQQAGEDNSFMQRVRFRKGLLKIDSPSLTITHNSQVQSLTFLDDFVVSPNLYHKNAAVSADVAFVGYGIVAPEFDHNDYEGVDVSGKVVVYLTGKPRDLFTEVGAHLSSTAMKTKNAADRGAIGIIVIQTPSGEQSRPFERNKLFVNAPQMSWLKGEKLGSGRSEIQASAFLNISAATKLFEGAEISIQDIYSKIENDEGLTSFHLPTKISLNYQTEHQEISSPNVIGLLEGSDPVLKNEYVVYTAHSDHLGISKSVEKDKINNGAMDNAAGTSVLIETARMFSELTEAPKRSILFVAVTGEERGLLGADYFVNFPTRPRQYLIANVNLDMPILTYEFADVIAFGAKHSSMGPLVESATRKVGITLTEDPWPELNLFTRSDHYAFVKKGIPAVFLVTGITAKDPNIDGSQVLNNFLGTHYHRPSDDMNQDFVWRASKTFTQVNFEIGLTLGNALERPTWNADSFFGNTFGKQ